MEEKEDDVAVDILIDVWDVRDVWGIVHSFAHIYFNFTSIIYGYFINNFIFLQFFGTQVCTDYIFQAITKRGNFGQFFSRTERLKWLKSLKNEWLKLL